MRRAKIIATIGPASSSPEMIKDFISSGLDVARVNMSHGDHDSCKKIINEIRKASKELGREIAVLMDLQGPKVRVDKLNAPLLLKEGEEWHIGTKDALSKIKSKKCIPTVYENLVEDCQDGVRILFDDGVIVAETLKREGNTYKIKIKNGGELKSGKGINLPECRVSAGAFTDKDRENLDFGLKLGIDYVALSFVKSAADLVPVREAIIAANKKIPIIAKIERQEAIDNIEDIFEVADAIMIARGDLGVELGNHRVPLEQKRIINMCNHRRKPVIVATQMLESMMDNPTPTRAEASDVANAIWDGGDAVMLSGETAAGKYPIESLKTMEKIVVEAEKTPRERPFVRDIELSSVASAVMMSASIVAEKVNAKKIISVTEYGRSCLRLSLFRPRTSVLAISPSLETVRKMNLYWGVVPHHLSEYNKKQYDFARDVLSNVKNEFGLSKGDRIVITHGYEGELFYGFSNSIKVEII